MKPFFSLAMALALSLAVNAATVSFSGITSTNAVKMNDLLLVDSALGGTNYVTRTATIATVKSALSIPTVPTGLVSNNVAQSGLLAVDATKTNGVAATFGMVTNAFGIFTGDTNSFVNGAGHLSQIYNVVTNYTLSGTNGITITGTTNGTNVTILVGNTNSGGGAWGTITGNIISQTDLSTALTNKVLKAGDTMTGALVAPAVNVSDLLVGAMAVNRGTLTHAGGNVIMDLSLTNRYWSCTLTGNVQFVLTNCSAGKWANVLLTMPATNCTPLWPVASTGITNWFGGAPSTLTGGAIGALSFYAVDSTTNSTKAAYAETQ